MIRKININNLGIYQNFQWDTIRDSGKNEVLLKKVNVFYGRNYSGKTTLSKIIRAVETHTISDKYEHPDFELILEGGRTVDHHNFKDSDLFIRCFNEDFIKENLRFVVNEDEEIVPFAIIGDNTGIEEEIDEIKKVLGDNIEGEETLLYNDHKLKKSVVDTAKTELSRLEGILEKQLGDKATVGSDSIKKQYAVFGDINYNISKLKSEISRILNEEITVIDEDQKISFEKLIKEDEKPNVPTLNAVNLDIEQLHSTAKELASREILGTDKISELLEDARLNRWAKDGYDLHKDRTHCSCSFCGNTITLERWDRLDKHFDEETEKLERDLQNFISVTTDESEQIKKYKDKLSMNSFYSEFQDQASELLNEYNDCIDQLIAELEDYISSAERRLGSILRAVDFEKVINTEVLSKINQLYIDISDLSHQNDAMTASLKNRKTAAQIELRLYEIKIFIDTIKYVEQLQLAASKKEILAKELDALSVLELDISDKESLIEELGRQLNDEEEGAKRVNYYLNNYFGHEHLKLKAAEEEVNSVKKIRFNIMRGKKIAYHLSEGEISLISFCYFMAKLDDIHTLGRKPIIMIDDPISSLDANHIFYLYSVINSELFVKNRFEQIFLSTHNLDFLKYLKRLDLSSLQASKTDKVEHFIINRQGENSVILLMPSYLKDYVTEFNYLFDQIYRCAKADAVGDNNHHIFYNFGNNARKFLEALLFYKYPTRIGTQSGSSSKRLLRYFGNDNQATLLTDRVNNELSHLEEIFDRGMQPIDIPEMKKVAQFILDNMQQKDPEQFEALLESIGAPLPTLVVENKSNIVA